MSTAKTASKTVTKDRRQPARSQHLRRRPGTPPALGHTLDPGLDAPGRSVCDRARVRAAHDGLAALRGARERAPAACDATGAWRRRDHEVLLQKTAHVLHRRGAQSAGARGVPQLVQAAARRPQAARGAGRRGAGDPRPDVAGHGGRARRRSVRPRSRGAGARQRRVLRRLPCAAQRRRLHDGEPVWPRGQL